VVGTTLVVVCFSFGIGVEQDAIVALWLASGFAVFPSVVKFAAAKCAGYRFCVGLGTEG
jgi:hypothetical protein